MLTLVLLILSITSFSQKKVEIEGLIIDKETAEPVPYASVFSGANNRTKSNVDGFFKIQLNDIKDSIYISYIGYKKEKIAFLKSDSFYYIYLNKSSKQLQEIKISPKDNSFVFDLIQKCKKKYSTSKQQAKAYSELKSYINDQQVELIENYYNIDIDGYDLIDNKLKAGRIALLKDYINNRFFTSQESSIAIMNLKLLKNSNENFPVSPLWLNKSKQKQKFYLDIIDNYVNNELDSIIVIKFMPRDTAGGYFSGKLWLNLTHSSFEKVTLQCQHCSKHPFSPIRNSDSIKNVTFNITTTFSNKENQFLFNQIDFDYSIDYSSLVNTDNEANYTVRTKAILFAYDLNNLFLLPKFEFSNISAKDYTQINAYPFNEFFWKYNNEIKLHSNKVENDLFFNDSNAYTNQNHFKALNSKRNINFNEQSYIHWSKNRIIFSENIVKGKRIWYEELDMHDSILLSNFNRASQSQYNKDKWRVPFITYGNKSEPFNISVKLFMDINFYNDSLNILTSTILDPYESYYYLPMYRISHCFINMNFDICEIARKSLVNDITNLKDIGKIQFVYNKKNQMKIENLKSFINEVSLGANKKEMYNWNKYIIDNLNIDNIKIFKPYPKE